MHWTDAQTSPAGQSAEVLQPPTQVASRPQEMQTCALPQSASVRQPPSAEAGCVAGPRASAGGGAGGGGRLASA
jgi:hypothetical protein